MTIYIQAADFSRNRNGEKLASYDGSDLPLMEIYCQIDKALLGKRLTPNGLAIDEINHLIHEAVKEFNACHIGIRNTSCRDMGKVAQYHIQLSLYDEKGQEISA